ncbi:2-C-methyl-D-erythritol 4-phosphate cytidylyltransferase [Inhella sp.]|uniref:2-C-methyl-D-erythritol 4-phosphate cytidylyltransferase n=1 Tax=Inhella sp. TaxID=1921806 RepID=UPI0035B18CC3
MSERFYALVPAAGSGSRAGQPIPKQYVELAGRSLIAHTLAALAAVPELAQTLVVLAPDDARFAAAVPGFAGWSARCGGATRAASVRAGLQALRERGAGEQDWVLVHDAARCLLRPEWVQGLIEACRADAVGGLLAQPVADTLKRADSQSRVQHTQDRRELWAAQTPQMFRLGLLARALDAAGETVTDEASAIEQLGLAPRLVRAPLDNFKLTLPEDFALAELILRSRQA